MTLPTRASLQLDYWRARLRRAAAQSADRNEVVSPPDCGQLADIVDAADALVDHQSHPTSAPLFVIALLAACALVMGIAIGRICP